MLTRLRFRRDFRLIARCLSDKPSDNDGKAPDDKSKHSKSEKEPTESSTEKIQQLLKAMLVASKETPSEHPFAVAPDRSRRRKPKADEIEVKTVKIEETLTKAAEEVAHVIGGDVKQTEAELLSKVLGKINQTSTSLSDLISGMKVDRTKDNKDGLKRETRGQQVKKMIDKSKTESQKSLARFTQRKSRPPGEGVKKSLPQPTTVDIFGGQPLGIFKSAEPNYGTKLELWQSLKERELTLATSQPPANYFEKMIQWTDQGKVWKFPIDNEQGMEEEQSIHFSEHVFLDSHLEGWCPQKGPIRHFMELVCVGLSKNPFYTVQEKRDHILWYKEYFESKKDILTEVGAWEQVSTTSKATT